MRTVEERTTRIVGEPVLRGSLHWQMVALGVAFADLDRVTFRFRRRRHRWKPYLYVTTAVVAFDVAVKLTAMVLDRL